MRIKICSDLHFEFHKDKGHGFIRNMDSTDVDVLVLAGDITQHYWAHNHIRELCDKFSNVVLIAGNHEHYDSSFEQVRHIFNTLSQKIDNFNFLDNSTITIGGQRFVGTTLWFPDGPTNFMYKHGLNDFEWIRDFEKKVYTENKNAQEFLYKTVDKNDIVVTHHLPSFNCVSSQYRNGLDSALNVFFVCDMEKLIMDKQPKIWCHGHGHNHSDMMFGKTRVIRNPLAYPHEHYSCGYIEKLIIEV